MLTIFMRAVILFISFFFLSSFHAPPFESAATRLRYKVIKDGKQIGEIQAIRYTSGQNVVYEVETEMGVKVLLSQKLNYKSKAVYVNDLLQYSVSKSYLNDKLHNSCISLWKGNRYEIRRDKIVNTLSRQVNYSGVLLYFREPNTVNLVYSEMTGQDNSISRNTDGSYTLLDSKSRKKNKYWYKGGLLHRAMIDHSLFDFELVRVN